MNISMNVTEFEKELAESTGVLLGKIPDIEASVIVSSPECGIYADSHTMKGLKFERYHSKFSDLALLMVLMGLVQIYLVQKQIEYSSTQSALSRVSLFTILIQLALDLYLCLSTLSISVSDSNHFFLMF